MGPWPKGPRRAHGVQGPEPRRAHKAQGPWGPGGLIGHRAHRPRRPIRYNAQRALEGSWGTGPIGPRFK